MTQPTAGDVQAQRREIDLDVSAAVVSREVEYGTDGTGRAAYRHIITTDWKVLPDA